MNCPKCGSQKVLGMGGVMWCPDCKRSSDTSSVPPDDPALKPIIMPCPTCSKQVSTHADYCPSCGQPLRALALEDLEAERRVKASNHLRNVLALATLAFFICFWIWHLLNDKPPH